MKALKTAVAVFLFMPGSFLLLYGLWMWLPGVLIGALVLLMIWAGVELLK